MTTYTSTTCEHYEAQIQIDDNPYCLEFWDTGSAEKDENIRKYCWENSEAFIIAFNLLGIVDKYYYILFQSNHYEFR